ncbi:DNA-3-methyladenine glycosylase [compost metagenome]
MSATQASWMDRQEYVEIIPPPDFSFRECLIFLSRSDEEIMHTIQGECIYKALSLSERSGQGEAGCMLLLKITYTNHRTLHITFPEQQPSDTERALAAQYVMEWFDLDKDLEAYYQLGAKDSLLAPLITRYRGLRVIGIPELFEALVWAVAGQQIHLGLAYRMKRNLVQQYGRDICIEGTQCWLFPEPAEIAVLEPEDLRPLKFTTRKAEYIIGIARQIAEGSLSRSELLQLDPQQARDRLLAIRGVGAWTADYVRMKCLRDPLAFPIADAGLHQAIRAQLSLPHKPEMAELEAWGTRWAGWQAYATFYLWRSLYDERG